MEEAEVDVAFLGVVFKHLADTSHEGHEVGLFTVEVHLLLVNLSDVENLVDKVEDALCVMLNRVNIAAGLLLVVRQAAAQVGQRRHDERQRRTDVMRGIDEELHLLLIELLIGMAAIGNDDKGNQACEDGEVDEVGRQGTIPRRTDGDDDDLLGGVVALSHSGTHGNAVGAWLQMAQGEVVLARRIGDPFAVVDTVLIDAVHRVVEVKLRERQGDSVVEVAQREIAAFDNGFFRNLHAVEHGTRVDRLVADRERREAQRFKLRLSGLDVARLEDGQSVVVAEKHHIVVGVHTHAVEILFRGQTIVANMTDERLLLGIVLPDTHRRGAPDIAIVRLDDVADGLVPELSGTREEGHASSLMVVEIESTIGSYGDITVTQLTDREADDAVEQLVPAVTEEAAVARVVAGDARGRSHPDDTVVIGSHTHHPVVAEVSHLDGILTLVAVILQFARLRVIDAEATGEGRDVDVALSVAGHIVETVTFEADLLLRGARQRVVGVECIVGAYPVALLQVAEDELRRFGG